MKTTIDIDEELLEEATKLAGFSTKKKLVNFCLKEFIRLKSIERLKGKLGKLPLTLTLKDLEKMREDES